MAAASYLYVQRRCVENLTIIRFDLMVKLETLQVKLQSSLTINYRVQKKAPFSSLFTNKLVILILFITVNDHVLIQLEEAKVHAQD